MKEAILKREKEISGLLKASRAVLKCSDFKTSSRAIFDACTELIGVPAGYIGLLTPNKEEIQIVFLDPGIYTCTVNPDLPMPIRGMRGEVVKSKKPLYNNNFPETDWLRLMPKGHVDLENVLFTPLLINDEVQGLMGLANKPGGFTEKDAKLAMAFAEFVTIALQNSQMLESLENSEQKLIERTKKLKKSEELYRKAYDQVNFYKDLLTHDINNILQTIKTAVELSFIYLNDPEKSKELREVWNLVNSQINRADRLFLNVRRLSQIDYTEILIQPTEVFSVIQEAIKFTQKGIQAKKINFQIDSPFKTYNIKANELLLDVFENILINAIRYNDNQIIEILIKISKLQKDRNNFLKLEFIDNGIGISDNSKKIIFQKGYKKEKQSKGMGLGLSLVTKIIESYNGQIWVEDKVSGDYTKGSNFIIIIPEE